MVPVVAFAGNHAGKTPDTVAHLLVESTMSEGVVWMLGVGDSAVVLESTGRNSAMAETKHKALTEKCVPSPLSLRPRKSLLPLPAGEPEELSAAATGLLAGTQNAETTSRGHSFICATGGSHRGSEIHNMQLPSITTRLCMLPQRTAERTRSQCSVAIRRACSFIPGLRSQALPLP